jgi:hypothetical protein
MTTTTATTRKPLNITPAREAWAKLKAAEKWLRSVTAYGTDANRAAAAAKVDAAKQAFAGAAAPITDWIATAESRASVRLLTAGDIMDAIDGIPDTIRKKHLPGCEIRGYDPNAQSFPGRYHGTPESTHVDLICRASGWAIAAIYRRQCTSDRGRLVLTDGAKADIIAAAETL